MKFLSKFNFKSILVIIGVCAFLIHFYWTKIGVAEIWNTTKWSSMRSSVYQTLRRFSRAGSSKFASERPLSSASVYSSDIDNDILRISSEKKIPTPMITSYIIHPTKPVPVISYNNSIHQNYPTRMSYSNGNNNNRENDLAGMIQKQRF